MRRQISATALVNADYVWNFSSGHKMSAISSDFQKHDEISARWNVLKPL